MMERAHYNQSALPGPLRYGTIWFIIGLCCWQVIRKRYIVARSALVREKSVLFYCIISNLTLIATVFMSTFSKPCVAQ